MEHAPPPPLCRADALSYSLGAQGATQGLMVSIAVTTQKTCLLPRYPDVQILVGDRRARARRSRLGLGTEEQPIRRITPRQGAWAMLRWENFCGSSGPVSLRITLGGRSVVRRLLGPIRPPVCSSRSRDARLAVSYFVRR